MIICHFAIFMQGRAQLGEKRGFIYAWAEFYLQPIVGWNCTWADHYLWAVICRSRGGLLVNENEENFASNDNNLQWTFTILLVVSFISFTFWYLGCHQYCVGFKDSGNIWFWRWEQSEYKPLLDDHPWGSEKPHALIHIMYMNRTTQRFSYDLEMKTREQKRNNKRTEIQQFDWFIERIQTHLAFGWLSELSRNRFDVILQQDWPIEQCLLHIRVFFGGKTKSLCLVLFIHWLINQITNTYRNHFSRPYENRCKRPMHSQITLAFFASTQIC